MTTRFIRRARFIGDDRNLIIVPTDGVVNVSAIAVGDFVWWDSGNSSAASMVDQTDYGTKLQNQIAGRQRFIGIATTALAALTEGTVTVAQAGVFEVACTSASYFPGQLVGFQGTGTAGAVGVSATAVEQITVATNRSAAMGIVNAASDGAVTLCQIKICSGVFADTLLPYQSFDFIYEATLNGGIGLEDAVLCLDGLLSNSPTSGLGYTTGAGGTVTQATSKSTGVTLSKVCGAITMHNASLAADAIVSFVLTNTAIAAGDVLVLNHISGGTIGAYVLNAQCAAGSATINVANRSAGALTDAIVIQFALHKAVSA